MSATTIEPGTVVFTLGNWEVRYQPDPDPENEPWVICETADPDHDCYDCYYTKREAVAWVKGRVKEEREEAEELAREEAEEARQDRMQALRDTIADTLCECESEAVLTKILAMLTK